MDIDMTIEDLLDIKDPSILEKMSDAELTSHLVQYLTHTRPESPEAIHKEKTGRIKQCSEVEQMFMNLTPEKKKRLEDLAKAQGIDIEDLL